MDRYSPPLWRKDLLGRIIAIRDAEFYHQLPGGRLGCDLCYLECKLDDGQAGACGYRRNDGGKMSMPFHGENTCSVMQHRGYGPDPFLFYKPGTKSLMLGQTHCMANCTFCMSKEITWEPDSIPWAGSFLKSSVGKSVAMVAARYAYRAMLPPAGAIEIAESWGCRHIEFGINEPLLSWEYTYDVARLAKQAGLQVVIETNGLTTPKAIRAIAPYVDSVQIGVKGSGDADFYRQYVKAAGGHNAVKTAITEWKAAGVHLIIGDVVAPPNMQTNTADKQRQFYSWIADNIGANTPLLICPLFIPGPLGCINKTTDGMGYLTENRGSRIEENQYLDILYQSLEIARDAGLHYAHIKSDAHIVTCHCCGNILLQITHPDHIWQHQIFVTGNKCDHCGATVPIINDL